MSLCTRSKVMGFARAQPILRAFTFGYDAENRLTSASGAGNTVAYTYDGRGRRKTKTVNGTTTVFVTDNDNREVLEYDGASGAILRWYPYGLGPNDVLNQMNVAAGTRATLVPDIQGSVIASLDSSSGTLSRIGYLPYGKSANATGPFGYSGQRIDPETNGLYYYRARMYAPAWGRFMEADPLGTLTAVPQAGVTGTGNRINLYAYVENDPLNKVDPTGLGSVSGGQNASPAPGVQLVAGSGYFITGGKITNSTASALDMSRAELGTAIHSLKDAAGLGGADNIIIHIPSGDAFFNGEYIGNLKDE
jgi:RHS repeat-associated protein